MPNKWRLTAHDRFPHRIAAQRNPASNQWLARAERNGPNWLLQAGQDARCQPIRHRALFGRGNQVSPPIITRVIEKIRSLSSKNHEEQIRAVKATVRHGLVQAGILPKIGPRHIRTVLADNLESANSRLRTLALIEHDRYVKELLANPLYEDKRRLPPSGFKVYSQNDEDGIIQEIFARIGLGSRTFVEFGVENGLENNTLKLLLEGWSGLWLEGSEHDVQQINTKFRDVIEQGRLQVRHAFIDRDNINGLIGARRQSG